MLVSGIRDERLIEISFLPNGRQREAFGKTPGARGPQGMEGLWKDPGARGSGKWRPLERPRREGTLREREAFGVVGVSGGLLLSAERSAAGFNRPLTSGFGSELLGEGIHK